MKEFIRQAALFSLLLLLIAPVFSQDWEWSRRFGGLGQESVGDLEFDSSGNYLVSGLFLEDFQLGDDYLEVNGAMEAFLAKFDQNGQIQWAMSMGGPNADALGNIEIGRNGNIYGLGEFWIEGYFGGDTLYSAPTSKAAFLLKLESNGEQLWSQAITGTSTKTVSGLVLDAEDNLLLTGVYSDTLLLKDTFLTTVYAEQLFVLKLDSDGDFVWARNFRLEGDYRGSQMAMDPAGNVVLAGNFMGTLYFGNQELESVSTDFDIFVAKLDPWGDPLWARTGKGILDDHVNAIGVDNDGSIFISGNFIGEMDLGDNIQIATPGFNDNLFLLKYDPAGNPVWGRGLNSNEFNDLSLSLDIALKDQSVIVTGYFKDELIVDQWGIDAHSDHFNGFLAAFKKADGAAEWLKLVPCSGQLLSTELSLDIQNRIHIAGVFTDTAFFDDLPLVYEGGNDIFVARFDLLSTPVYEVISGNDRVSVFPNPVYETLNIETSLEEFFVQVYDTHGRRIMEGRDEKTIDLSTLSPGSYWLRVENAIFAKTIFLIKL